MNKALLQQYHKDGYVILKSLLDDETVSSLKQGANILVDRLANSLSEVIGSDLNQEEPLETRLLSICKGNLNNVPLLYRRELHMREFYPLFFNKHLVSCVKTILSQAEAIRLFPNYSLRPKIPNYGPHDIVWHQDAAIASDGGPHTAPIHERHLSFGVDAMVNCWTPLVTANKETGCMLAIPGTHRLGIQSHVKIHKYRNQEESGPYGLYATQICDDVVKNYENDAVYLECEPGDVILFSNLLFHRGGFNKSSLIRWSFDWRYQDADRPTFRDETSHLVYSSRNRDRVVENAIDWAQLSL